MFYCAAFLATSTTAESASTFTAHGCALVQPFAAWVADTVSKRSKPALSGAIDRAVALNSTHFADLWGL